MLENQINTEISKQRRKELSRVEWSTVEYSRVQ